MSDPKYASGRSYLTEGENCLITRNSHDMVTRKGAVAANTVWKEGQPVNITAAGVVTALVGAAWTVADRLALAFTDVDTTGAPGTTEFVFLTQGPFVSERVIARALNVATPLPAALVTAIGAAGLILDTQTIAQ
ncbi:MAG: hypothetical protein ACRDAM_15705 [Casimicrobium sp.]